MRQIAKRYIWEETMEQLKTIHKLFRNAISFSKVPVITLRFYIRLMLVLVSLTKRKLKLVLLLGKKAKSENSISVFVYLRSRCRMGAHPKQWERQGQAPTLELNSASQYRDTRSFKLRSLCALSSFILCKMS